MSVRVIQVGLGPWGLNWAKQIIPTVAGIQTTAFVARRPESLENAQRELNLASDSFFNSLDSALAAAEADAVLVLTNTSSHVPLIESALNAEKHVLVEKPFTARSADALRLAELAERKGLTLMVNQNFRFFPAALTALKLLRDRELGELNAIDVDFRWLMAFPTHEAGRFHYEREQALLMDLSIHHFDLMRLMIGSEPASIYCRAWQPPGSHYRDPVAAAAIIQFRNDVTVTYRASWLSRGTPTTFSGDWRMECEDGEIRWRCRKDRDLTTDGDQVVVRRLGEADRVYPLEESPQFGRAGVLAAFVSALQSKRRPEHFSSAADNVNSVRLMEAAVESAESEVPVHIV